MNRKITKSDLVAWILREALKNYQEKKEGKPDLPGLRGEGGMAQDRLREALLALF